MRADKNKIKHARLVARKHSIRNRLIGTDDRPRLTVYPSVKHIYAQVIDDIAGRTIASAGTVGKSAVSLEASKTGNIAAAKAVGKAIAERAKAAGIKKVAFDRNGRRYHGRVKALADAAREAGLTF
jgi:large subunit ribosomal protein L18